MGVMRLVTGATMVACLAIAVSGVEAVAFCLTAFFLVWIMCIAMSVATRLMEFEADTIVYFSPWVRARDSPAKPGTREQILD